VPTFEDVKKLQYCEAVMKETLRLFPIVSILSRRSPSKEAHLGDFVVPPNTPIFYSAWAIQRDAKYFEDPDLFKPERFLLERNPHTPSGAAWIPFGDGARICVGMKFALMETCTILALISQRYDLLSAAPQPIQVERSVTSQPADPYVFIRRREDVG